MIFFDLDGTLLDHKRSEYLGVNAFYNLYKHDISVEKDFYEFWHDTAEKYYNKYLNGEMSFNEQRIKRMQEIFSPSGVKLSDEDAEEMFRIYTCKYEENWTLFDDVIPCLNALSNYKLGVITNGDSKQQHLKLEKLKIKNYFDTIIISGEAGVAKPDIKIFEIACNKANERPENCYFVGDNLDVDILPCPKIGIHGIWLNRNNEQSADDNIITIHNLKKLKKVIDDD